MKKLLIAIASITVAGMAVTACTDKSYDLSGGVDLSMNVDANVAMPLGSTEFISIGDFLKLGDEDIIVCDEGNYYIRISGPGTTASIDIPSVTFDNLDAVNTKAEIKCSDIPITNLSDYIGYSIVDVPGLPETVEIASLRDGEGNKPNFTIEINSDALPAAIKDVQWVDLDNSRVSMNFSMTEGKIELNEGLKLTFPSFFVLEAVDKNLVDVEGNVATLKAAKEVVSGTACSIDFNVKRIDMSAVPNHGIQSGGNIVLQDNIEVDGGVTLYIKEFSTVPAKIEVTIGISSASAFSMSGASVKADVVESVSVPGLELTDIPEFFEGTNLDIYNPLIWIDVDNQTSLSPFIAAKLVTSLGGAEQVSVQIGETGNEVEIEKECRSKIYIAGREDSSIALGSNDQYLVKPELLGLFSNPLPDMVTVEDVSVGIKPDEFTEIRFPIGDISVSYALDTPLAFGPDMHFSTSFKIDDLGDLLGSEGKISVDVEKIELNMKMKNTLPLDITVQARALDEGGNPVAGVESESARTPAGVESAPIKIVLSGGEALSQMKSLELVVSLDGSETAAGQILNENQGIQILNMSAKLVANINADFSKNDNEE